MPAGFRRDLRVVIGLAAAPVVALGLSRFAYALLLPAMRSDLGWSFSTAGLMNTVNALGYLVGALGTAWLAARTGQYAALLGSLVVTVVALAGTAFLRELGPLLVLRGVLGVTGAVTFIVGAAITASLTRARPGREAALLIGTYFAGGGIGIIVSGLAVPAVLDRLGPGGWPQGWAVLAVLALAGTIVATLAAGATPTSAPRSGDQHRWPPGLVVLSTGYLLFGAGYIGYMTFIVAVLAGIGLGAHAIAVFWVLLGIGGSVGGWVWAPLLRRARGGSAAAALMVLLTLACAIPAGTTWPPALYLSGILFGLCFLSVASAITAAARDAVPPARTTAAFALITTAFALGQVVGPWLTGALADGPGGLPLGLGVSAAILLVGAGMCRLHRPGPVPGAARQPAA